VTGDGAYRYSGLHQTPCYVLDTSAQMTIKLVSNVHVHVDLRSSVYLFSTPSNLLDTPDKRAKITQHAVRPINIRVSLSV